MKQVRRGDVVLVDLNPVVGTEQAGVDERESRWHRLMQAVGSCRDTDRASDVAERHDAYLSETYSGG